MVGAFRTDDLRLVEDEGLGRGVADNHACDIESRTIYVTLGNVGVGDIDPMFVRSQFLFATGSFIQLTLAVLRQAPQ